MISFRQKVTLHEIEAAYESIGGEGGGVLRVPSALRFGGNIGVHGALIQFISYWARTVINSHLRLYGESLADEPHGIAALYFASQTSGIGGEPLSKREALQPAVPRIAAMQEGRYLDTMHGRGVFLACFAGAKNEYLKPFYASGSEDSLRSRDEFITLTNQIISACAPSTAKRLTPERLVAIGSLLYELFKNTHEHAVTNEMGVRYDKSVRAVLAKFVSVQGTGEGEGILSSEDSSHAFFFLRNLANKQRHMQDSGRLRSGVQSHFLELTVLDTGPGLVRRWLSRFPGRNLSDLSIADEVDIVKRCFEMHASTKENRSSGGGLDRVVQTLTELKGFLRLRTGRVCLVQDFSSEKSRAFAPRHWDTAQEELPLTTGAVYSIIIPLSRTQP
ncbi:hypothetical protein [Ralstonia pickettii]|uniref:hypothetical protein n=1 Tax=Ralstonia pickettii TaxID=329 RepID=UPI00081885B0|nr:hypothetical protein [Ralstonia pickettii]